MKKKVVLFDHDGVLVETEQWYFLANKRAFREIGLDLELEPYLDFMARGESIWEFISKEYSAKVIAEQREKRNLYYREYLQTEEIEIADVLEVLKKLSEKYRMAIVTTSKRVDFELIHDNRDIVQYMDFVLTLEDYENAKPHPEPYLKALEKFSVLKNEALVVEDSARGLRSAIAAGIDCAVVDNEFTKTHDFTGARYRIRNLSELFTIL
ncbi:HAD family phosphatase [Aurantivibrio infirmus]